ncbi:hypothetical protein ACHAW5_004536 [Stephanodiscus triporus]|uniref:Sulfotransferase domain-containing protein n=1 Tax=Stephanodiscus triporus TaxID=2934178 RepID=A0ABD3PTI4_9STRA
MLRLTLIAGLFNLLALSALFIKCNKGYREAAHKLLSDAPELSHTTTATGDDDDDYDEIDQGRTTERDVAIVSASGGGYTPSHLRWDMPSIEEPEDWSFKMPRYCENAAKFRPDREQKIIVHFHMQHNAGTEFWQFASRFTPCATRACWQDSKHCMVSYNEEVEAENIRQNYINHGVQYVSYELMLPPRFPLPFVSETARRGIFFTTIVRNPFKRFLTYVRRHASFTSLKGDMSNGRSPFWIDLQERRKRRVYAGDNLNARWLSGAIEHISIDHVNIAKCRLQLFDLVIADNLYEYALKKVMCPLNNWKGGRDARGKILCDDTVSKEEHKSKPDPLNGTDAHFIGAWVERLRPSFEIYDYARLISWKQLNERGVKDLPELSEVPSYMETLARYTNMEVTDIHFKEIKRVNLENEDHFHPPVEFCNRMKKIWTSNPDASRVSSLPRGGAAAAAAAAFNPFPAGYNPFGFGLTDLGKTFLDFEGSIESDVGRFLSTLKSGGGKRKSASVLKDQWLEIVRVSKTGQSMRIYRRLDDMIEFCLKAGLVD